MKCVIFEEKSFFTFMDKCKKAGLSPISHRSGDYDFIVMLEDEYMEFLTSADKKNIKNFEDIF